MEGTVTMPLSEYESIKAEINILKSQNEEHIAAMKKRGETCEVYLEVSHGIGSWNTRYYFGEDIESLKKRFFDSIKKRLKNLKNN